MSKLQHRVTKYEATLISMLGEKDRKLKAIKKDLEERAALMRKYPYSLKGITCDGIAEIFDFIIKTHFGEVGSTGK